MQEVTIVFEVQGVTKITMTLDAKHMPSALLFEGTRIRSMLRDAEWLKKIPKEEIGVYLQVTAVEAKVRNKKRGKQDIHEKNFEFLAKSEKMYEKLSRKYKHWVKINCEKNKSLRSKEDIHKEIIRVLKRNRII